MDNLDTWAAPGGSSRIGISTPVAIDWKSSLRKVEDIIVKENKLKVGDKVMVNKDVCGFKKGQIVDVYELNNDGIHLFKGDNSHFCFCDGEEGAYLWDYEYDIIKELPTPSGHPHADLMLKYAMIAQYDDKPWESFEFKNQYTHRWMRVVDHPCWDAENEYRLKPQDPKIQVGQIWVSKEGVEVTVSNLANKLVFTKIEVGGLTIPWSFKQNQFFNNFKPKENK